MNVKTKKKSEIILKTIFGCENFFIAISKLRNIPFNLTNLNGKYFYMQYLLFVLFNDKS